MQPVETWNTSNCPTLVRASLAGIRAALDVRSCHSSKNCKYNR